MKTNDYLRGYNQSRQYPAYKVSFTVPCDRAESLREFALDRIIELEDVRDFLNGCELRSEFNPAQIECVSVTESVIEGFTGYVPREFK